MHTVLDAFRFVLVAVSGWMNQRQPQVIDYLRGENRVLRERRGERRLRFTNAQRRRLAAKAKGLGSKLLREMATIAHAERFVRTIKESCLERMLVWRGRGAESDRRIHRALTYRAQPPRFG
jgi:hypothetical protein